MDFKALCAAYLDFAFRRDPVRASWAGVTEYDARWPQLSAEGQRSEKEEARRLLDACARFDAAALSPADRLDLQVMQIDLEDILLELELDAPAKDPLSCVTELARGISVLVQRDWMPPEEQLPALTNRLREAPAFLAAARVRLVPEQVPPLWVEMALQAVQAAPAHLETTVANFAGRLQPADRTGLHEALAQAISALADFGAFLEGLRQVARGSFAVGETAFSRILQVRHRLDLDAARLLKWGQGMVDQYEAEIEEAGRRLNPRLHWTESLDQIMDDYPPADQWLEAFRENMETSRQHVLEHDLVTIPPGESCRLVWTPEFMRSTYPLGGMDVTAPFTPGLESRFFITPNDEKAPAERQRQHHRDLNYTFLRSITFHEVYPGHHLQAVHAKLVPSHVRRWQRSTTLMEGWGLYTETLMTETGYLSDPRHHLMYVKNSLWRAVRVVVDVCLHTGEMTFDQAVDMMRQRLRMEEHMAAGEVRRYTLTPTYQSSYLLGRSAILDLRAAYAARHGSSFTLKRFHDELLSYGSIPVTLIREAMLPGN